MIVQVATAADFANLARPAYDSLLAGPESAAELLIEVAPGEYRDVNLRLGSIGDPAIVAVTIRAADSSHPPVFTDSSFHLRGRSVRLDHLVFRDCYNDGSTLGFTVRDRLAIHGCALIGCGLADRHGGSLVEVVTGGATNPVEAEFSDCWLIGNRARGSDRGELIRFEAAPPSSFGQIRFDNVAWLDNLATVAIVPGAARTVQAVNCVLVEPIGGANAAATFIAINSIDATVTFERALIVRDQLERLVTTWSAQHQMPGDFQAIAIRDSQIFVRDAPTLANQPANYQLTQSSVLATTRRTEATEHHVGVIRACEMRAERGLAPDRIRIRALLLD